MSDRTAQFFENLAKRGHEPLLEKMQGTMRFDLRENGHTDRWVVAVDKGDISIAHKGGPADCTLRADKSLFNRMTTGEVNATAAVLRGALDVEGESEFLVLFQRLQTMFDHEAGGDGGAAVLPAERVGSHALPGGARRCGDRG